MNRTTCAHLPQRAKPFCLHLPRKERSWHGEEDLCPVCHNSLFAVDNGAPYVTCRDCAIDGGLAVHDGALAPEFSPMQQQA